MNKLSILLAIGLSIALLTACVSNQSTPLPTSNLTDTEITVPATLTPTLPATLSATPAVVLVTPTPAPSATATFDPSSWQSLPVVPTVSDTARRIYANGLLLGNDPHAFSIVGDCLSLPINLFGNYGKGPVHYTLGNYTSLQPVIDWFKDSFNRQSITLGNGFNTAAELSPLRADPQQCQAAETPLACEYRIHHPSYVLITIGTDDNLTPPAVYEQRMRQIVEFFISKGVVPILTTKADNREGGYAFDIIIARLAYEYDIPLWNFWAAVQSLPNGGLEPGDQGHLTWGNPNDLENPYAMLHAIPIRNVTALQTLEAVWQGVTAP